MKKISYTKVQKKLAVIWDEILSSREPITISHKNKKSVVLVPFYEWQSKQEEIQKSILLAKIT